jgi:hypothetical protein
MRRDGPTSTYKSEGRWGGTKNVCGAVGSYGRRLIAMVDCGGESALGLGGDRVVRVSSANGATGKR